MKDTWYITTPIYYVNDLPHVGHAYTTVVADFLARWHRLAGRRVHFLTGTDEHGAKVAQAAAANDYEPRDWCDHIAPRWREVWERLRISNDDFIRTTEERHAGPVRRFMQELYDRDEIYLAPYEGLYCVRCEEYKSPSDLVDGDCPVHGIPPTPLKEDNYFFRLSKYTERLLRYYEEHPGFVRPSRARNELMGKLRLGLDDLAITRTSITWGIPVPWDEGHVIYVWIEALQNYLTAAGYGADEDRFSRLWPADVHLIGKEIVWQHAVVWPALLMAAGLPLPESVFAHGWLLAGGEKISKSGRGITQISPHELVEQFGVDGYRYHFLRSVRFGEDGNFSLEDMHARYNADLANDIGNLANRTIAMIDRYFEGTIPGPEVVEAPEEGLLAVVREAGPKADALVADLDVTEALNVVWEIVRHANRYLVERAPWKLAKDDANTPVVAGVLSAVAEAVATVAALLYPAMPASMGELWSRMGLEGDPALEIPAVAGRRVRAGDPLFPRLEAPE